VKAPSADELAAWKKLPFDEEEYREKEVGASKLVGEKGYSVLARTWVRPTLDVHGIVGGFIGAGAKTVIPAKATAKVSMRLVPDMTPEKSFRQYKEYVEKIKPEGVSVEVRLIHSGEPIVIGTGQSLREGRNEGAEKKCGGRTRCSSGQAESIPIVGDFEKHLKIPSVMMGFGLPDDGLHAPNEKSTSRIFIEGLRVLIEFFDEVGNQGAGDRA